VLDEKYYHPPVNYIYICYLDQEGESLRKLPEYVNWARELKRMSDNIIILFVLNSGANAQNALLSIEDDLYADTEIYYFTVAQDASEVKKQAVVSSVGAAIILNSFQEQVRDHMNRKANALATADQYIDDLSEEAVTKYYEDVEPYGIGIDVYYDYSKQKSKCKGTDNNGDGKTDSGSKKAEILQVIDSLPISRSQKDVLYYLNGWSARTIYEAPWH
jgi:hypothetical protein